MDGYRILFMITLAFGAYMGFRRGGDFAFVAMVLIASWVVSFFTWNDANPIWTNAVSDLLFASIIAAFCQARTAVIVGVTFALSAHISIIYGMANVPNSGYNLWYAHSLSALGHIENLVLAIGAWDGGIRIRNGGGIRRLWASVDRRGLRSSRSDLDRSES
jgi:hypothetical protein